MTVKRIVQAGFLIAFCLPSLAAFADDADTIRMLRAENKLLRSQIKSLTADVTLLRAEIKRLKSRPTSGPASQPAADPDLRGDAAELRKLQARAENVSKKYVRKFLKHPDDASFGFWSVPEIKCNAGRDTFFVSSTVKAKNDFGAELTYRWATIVFLDGGAWKLVSCVIDDKEVYEDKALLARLAARKK